MITIVATDMTRKKQLKTNLNTGVYIISNRTLSSTLPKPFVSEFIFETVILSSMLGEFEQICIVLSKRRIGN